MKTIVLVALVACGARTDLGGGHVDAGAADVTQEQRACSYCGGQSDEKNTCELWAYCPGEIAPDASAIVCNDAPHVANCSCHTGTCTCVSGGKPTKTIPFTTCPCDGVHFSDPTIAESLVATCAF